ncbi:MAG: GxxExxY protein [Gemmatimonadaceae bacterium]|nr:GxxExxY protein [Gemmatimonadaceae bacterium]
MTASHVVAEATRAITSSRERDPLMDRVLGCAIEVHRTLGPGLLESAYAKCLAFELMNAGISFREQVPVPVVYKRVRLECGYRLDLLVENRIVIEIKCATRLNSLHRAQVLTYMRLIEVELGYLLNFNAPRLIDGICRLRLFPPDATQ